MNSTDRVNGLNTSSPIEENRQEERKITISTLGGLDEKTENFQEKFSNVDKEFVNRGDMKEHSEKHINELKELRRDLEKKFKDLRDLIENNFASK